MRTCRGDRGCLQHERPAFLQEGLALGAAAPRVCGLCTLGVNPVSNRTELRKGQGASLPLYFLDDLESSLKRVFWKLSLPARPARSARAAIRTVCLASLSWLFWLILFFPPSLLTSCQVWNWAVPDLLIWLEGKTWGYFRTGNAIWCLDSPSPRARSSPNP